ncbi:uncharacterized protein HMPREF1541_10268 [Cyphellophora europaea CBS 101466]|uniref:DUF4185 domain-containing protein n=1 Tax=Cyphellophora europaea (strain CBS 101466) TaxID=1220924 RepID=W2S991_CYPE1|nr:uncharacterized protein HMPREF1541_10268 [Cyphellophora europaea CBS 101466]ETN44598.1 hypothetical protein HMPREF1541_10268 [Cyphellophora europaea CBS 101466]
MAFCTFWTVLLLSGSFTGAVPSLSRALPKLKRASGITSFLVEPESTFFSTANVAYSSTLNIDASDGDLWPTTWADDGSLYTANGDGRGFSADQADFGDIVMNRLDGTPETGITGMRLASGTALGPVWTPGSYNRKPTGIVAVDGDEDGHDELYLAVQDLNNGTAGPGGGPTGDAFNEAPAASILRSTDYGVTWTPTGKAMFSNHVFTTVFFLDFGQSNSHASVLGANDAKYVYAYGLDNNWRDSVNNAVPDPQDLYLGRAPISSIQDITTWEFFSGTASSPAWDSDINARRSVLHDNRREYPGGTTTDGFSIISQGSVVYNAPLDRYIYSSWSDYSFEFYEAPQPWGPFTLFHHKDFGPTPWFGMNTTTPKNGGYATTIPSKFISADGMDMWVQSNWFVGAAAGSDWNYCFSLRPLVVTRYGGSAARPTNQASDDTNLARADDTVAIDKTSHYGHLLYLNNGDTTYSEDSWDNTTKPLDRWGYTWPMPVNTNRVVYTTGDSFPDGGYFSANLTVQVRQNLQWTDVAGLKIDPPYPYSAAANPQQRFTFTFDDVVGDGVQIIGVPGGTSSFTSVAELEVYYGAS